MDVYQIYRMTFIFLIAILESFSLSAEFLGSWEKQRCHKKYIVTFSSTFHPHLRPFVNNVKIMPEILIENVSLELPIASCINGCLEGKQYCQCSCIFIQRAKSKWYFYNAWNWITLSCFGKPITTDQDSLSILKQVTSCTHFWIKSCISFLNTNKTVTLKPSVNMLFFRKRILALNLRDSHTWQWQKNFAIARKEGIKADV